MIADESDLLPRQPEGDGSREAMRNRPGLWFEMSRTAQGNTVFTLVWHHVLMDAAGAEQLAESFAHGLQSDLRTSLFGSGGAISRRSLWEYLRQFPRDMNSCRQAAGFISAQSAAPLALPVRESEASARHSACNFALEFDESESAAIRRRCSAAGAELHPGLFYLAAAGIPLAKLAERWGEAGGAFAISVPIARRGAAGGIVQNRIAFEFFRLRLGADSRLKDVYDRLLEQSFSQLRENNHRAHSTMMRIFCNLPLPLYSWLLRKPSRGRLNSFSFAFTGAVLDSIDELFGCRVLNIRHIAPITWPPGLAVVFTKFRKRLICSVTHIEDGWTQEDCSFFSAELERQLLGEG